MNEYRSFRIRITRRGGNTIECICDMPCFDEVMDFVTAIEHLFTILILTIPILYGQWHLKDMKFLA